MKYVISTFIFGLLLVPSFGLNAQVEQREEFFDIGTIVVDRLEKDEDIARFVVNVEDKDIKNAISYWKVRMYCEEGVTLTTSDIEVNECGTAVTFTEKELQSFTVLFKTTSNTVSNFSFALKAYNAEGDWLQTERKNFSWK